MQFANFIVSGPNAEAERTGVGVQILYGPTHTEIS